MGGIINKRGGLKCSQITIAATLSYSAHDFAFSLIGLIGPIVLAFDDQPGNEFEIRSIGGLLLLVGDDKVQAEL
jgi:hypothetical protein